MIRYPHPRLARLPRLLNAALLFLAGAGAGLAAPYVPLWLGLRADQNAAVVHISNGRKEWFLKGCRHRLDGPAVEWSTGMKEWWEHGEFIRAESPNRLPPPEPGQTRMYQ